jgi:hypothetical protein
MAALARVMMTMAGIAYGEPSAIPGYLAADTLTRGDWTPVWIAEPVDVPKNFAFIARNSAGDYCIAIRGTYPNPFSPAYWDDANEDSPLQDLVPWPLGSSDPVDVGPRISNGTATAFKRLLALSDGTDTFETAAGKIPPAATVFVTGHSLGGTLAPVVGLWITGLANAPAPKVFCFAGLTPGNQAFADLLGPGTRLAGRVTRYKNSYDSVPYGWNDVLATRDFYQPEPSGGLLVAAAVTALSLKLTEYGYATVGEEIVLQGVLNTYSPGCEFISYVIENIRQHLPDTYLSLLGAPSLPFTIGLGTLVIPRGHAMAAAIGGNKVPVYFV